MKERPIDNFDDFIKVLGEIDTATIGEKKTLKQFTRSKRTLLDEYISQFEPQLINRINSGAFARLSLIAGTTPQQYTVVS